MKDTFFKCILIKKASGRPGGLGQLKCGITLLKNQLFVLFPHQYFFAVAVFSLYIVHKIHYYPLHFIIYISKFKISFRLLNRKMRAFLRIIFCNFAAFFYLLLASFPSLFCLDYLVVNRLFIFLTSKSICLHHTTGYSFGPKIDWRVCCVAYNKYSNLVSYWRRNTVKRIKIETYVCIK